IENTHVATAEMNPNPPARPSSPSTKFIALTMTTTNNTASNPPWLESSTNTWPSTSPSPPHATQNTVHCTPELTSIPAHITCPASLVHASSSKTSSNAPMNTITPPPMTTPIGSSEYSNALRRTGS